MPNAIDHDHKYEAIMMEYDIRNAILDVANWKGDGRIIGVAATTICCAITHLEGDEATSFALWAYFLHVVCHMQTINKHNILGTLDVY